MEELNPLVLESLQNAYIGSLSQAFTHVGTLAYRLFYLVAAIELAWFGLIWAVRQDSQLGQFVIKIFKLSLIFTVITYYPNFVQLLLDGFTFAAFEVSPAETASYLYHPAKIWAYGFDMSIEVLKMAISTGTLNTAASNLYTMIGLGILLCFVVIGIQLMFVLISLYLTAILGLLLMPFGALTSLKRFFEKPIEQLMVHGVRVFTVVLVLGIGVQFWQQMGLDSVSEPTTLEAPLGLLFSAMAVAILMWRLPSTLGETVGTIFTDMSPNVTVNPSSPQVQTQASFSGQQAVAYAATSMSPQAATVNSTSTTQTAASQASVHYQASPAAQTTPLSSKDAAKIGRSISEQTVKALKKGKR